MQLGEVARRVGQVEALSQNVRLTVQGLSNRTDPFQLVHEFRGKILHEVDCRLAQVQRVGDHAIAEVEGFADTQKDDIEILRRHLEIFQRDLEEVRRLLTQEISSNAKQSQGIESLQHGMTELKIRVHRTESMVKTSELLRQEKEETGKLFVAPPVLIISGFSFRRFVRVSS